ncbi:Alcohol dehydrogenase superfamily [Zalerion maritima]|uniref:alcohol dehydrogenase (NADP(+)) n=1 Tax=Zalerion maritima TaxID=339359 RepID=A0AAD5RFM6_9PEZI|nr:Alcohol dehydrogenase superfamily [Zalerion maritima]
MGSQSREFQGWLGLDADSVKGNMKWQSYAPKDWEETDVDIKISHCGICGSDIHTLRSGWKPSDYPVCVGHEIIGTAIRVGSAVKHVKVGDRVGVGAQSDSCQNRPGIRPNKDEDCAECAQGLESYCARMVGTYGSRHFNGGKSLGGYGLYNRAPGHFVIPIPEGLDSADAAPMLCAGVTVYSPLKRFGAGPGKKVGIVGLGGLGHFGVLFARALGADKVVAISRREDKRADALKLGADAYVATAEEEGWAKKHKSSLDLIISTVSSAQMPLGDYMGMLKAGGTLVQVGAPEDGALPINAFNLIGGGKKVAGSMIGSPSEITEMLRMAADKGVKPWVEKRAMKDANQAVLDMVAGNARYRYVLVNEGIENQVQAAL